jgi:hypothetical protein
MATYKIGRAEGNHVVVGDKSVSRQHAELEELGAGRFRLKDLGSSSGTQMLSGAEWVDVRDTEVRHDTRIRLGEYETTPAELLKDQDKTVVQARPAAAAVPPPMPAAPRPPQPAPPRPAAPKPAAPRPTPPRPAAPRPAAAPGAPRPAGAGMDKKTMWILIGGGGGLLLLALIAVVVVLVTGDSQRTADVRPPARTETPAPPPPRTDTPAPPAQPPAPPAQPPAAQAGPQRLAQACRSWQGISEAACACVVRASTPVLQAGDYDGAIEIMGLVFTTQGDRARQRIQQIAAQDQGLAQRIVGAVQAIGRDCQNVQ